MLDMTRKPLSPQLGTKNHFLKKTFIFRKMSQNALGFISIHSVAKCLKTQRGDPLDTLNNFRKKSHSAEKKSKGGFAFSIVRFCRLR